MIDTVDVLLPCCKMLCFLHFSVLFCFILFCFHLFKIKKIKNCDLDCVKCVRHLCKQPPFDYIDFIYLKASDIFAFFDAFSYLILPSTVDFVVEILQFLRLISKYVICFGVIVSGTFFPNDSSVSLLFRNKIYEFWGDFVYCYMTEFVY